MTQKKKASRPEAETIPDAAVLVKASKEVLESNSVLIIVIKLSELVFVVFDDCWKS